MTTEAGRAGSRILSLLPAATEIVASLGAIDQLVGITHECDHPFEVASLPRVTSSAVDRDAGSAEIDAEVRALSTSGAAVFTLDVALVARLAPDLMLTQSVCDVCALPESEVDRAIAALPALPRRVTLGATTLDGVFGDIRRVADAIGRDSEGEGLVASLLDRMRRVHETLKAAKAPRPRVAVIEWLEPVFVAGHWTPELVRRAGGIDVLAEPGAHSVTVDVGAVRDANPDIVLFAPCGFDVVRAERESRALLATSEWSWARGLECWALDGNALTSRPGPRLVEGVEVLASIFAPGLFARPAEGYARRVGG
ncbi:MAG TPA: ABC transporter substrate-binding protein [Gemmatimonadaceae bacterium]|nr:ABC transporter substrate-binding protein [Gemmatimonadaceae bacterium]